MEKDISNSRHLKVVQLPVGGEFKSKDKVRVMLADAMTYAKNNSVASFTVLMISDTGEYYNSYFTSTDKMSLGLFNTAMRNMYSEINDDPNIQGKTD